MSKGLSRAEAGRCSDSYTEQAALRLLNLSSTDTPPVAACSYYHDFGELPGCYCLRADPVHLHVDLHGLVVFDGSVLAVTSEESQALVRVLADHLEQDGWKLRHGDNCRWYLLGEEQDLTAPALCQVRGQHAALKMLKGEHASRWTCRLNELQMLMSTHPCNLQRQSQRRKTINSLWLWGGGAQPGRQRASFDGVVSSNPTVLGAASINQVRSVVADSAEQLLEQMEAACSTCLVVLEQCRDAAAYADYEAWNQALKQLEAQWFEPLLSALSSKRLDAIELLPLNGFVYRLTRTDLRKFWRSIRDYRNHPGFRQATAVRV